MVTIKCQNRGDAADPVGMPVHQILIKSKSQWEKTKEKRPLMGLMQCLKFQCLNVILRDISQRYLVWRRLTPCTNWELCISWRNIPIQQQQVWLLLAWSRETHRQACVFPPRLPRGSAQFNAYVHAWTAFWLNIAIRKCLSLTRAWSACCVFGLHGGVTFFPTCLNMRHGMLIMPYTLFLVTWDLKPIVVLYQSTSEVVVSWRSDLMAYPMRQRSLN